jgi:integrase
VVAKFWDVNRIPLSDAESITALVKFRQREFSVTVNRPNGQNQFKANELDNPEYKMEDEFIELRDYQRDYERALDRYQNDADISKRNKEIVLSFIRDAALGKTITGRAKKKICKARLVSYLNQLYPLQKHLGKDLDKVTQEDMEDFIEALETDRILSRTTRLRGSNSQISRVPYGTHSKIDIKVTVRKFYKWLWGNNKTFPSIVDWIDTYMKPKEVQALTEREVDRMVDRCQFPVQRALIQVLFDGGFRIGELLNIRLKHVRLRSFDMNDPSKKCFLLRVPYSKTLPRTVVLPMHSSTRLLNVWLEDHPAQPIVQADGTLDCQDLGIQLFPMKVGAVRSILRNAGRRYLGKRVYPHLMRHTSATYWSNRLSYFKMCKRFGWTMTSSMPQKYIDREGVDEFEVVQIYNRDEQAKHPERNQNPLPEITVTKQRKNRTSVFESEQ